MVGVATESLDPRESDPPMPDNVHAGLIERWILDGPWPLAAILVLASLVLFVVASRRDDARFVPIAIGVAAAAVAVAVIGSLVLTPGEKVRSETRSLVADAVDGDVDSMIDRLSSDATLHIGRVESPGFPFSDLTRSLGALRRSQRIEENSITALESATVGEGSVYVELACLTRTASSYGYVPSRWIIEWTEDDERGWEIRSITAVSIAGRTPNGRNLFR